MDSKNLNKGENKNETLLTYASDSCSMGGDCGKFCGFLMSKAAGGHEQYLTHTCKAQLLKDANFNLHLFINLKLKEVFENNKIRILSQSPFQIKETKSTGR